MIQNGADVHAVTSDENRGVIHYAAEDGKCQFLSLLIKHGVNIHAVDGAKWTPLHVASDHGHFSFAGMLIQNGADMNAMTASKMTAMSLAGRARSFRCVLHLICAGAKITEKALEDDKTLLIGQVHDRLNAIQNGEKITTLYSPEEKKYIYSFACALASRMEMLSAKTFYEVCSYFTFRGILMAPGYGRGEDSVWNNWHKVPEIPEN